ncbi:hypothetical protein [Aestuariibius sp. HNIBRBA575]|uniref:hypothetical protein n=1 Tax=Aestuariibius sp. HNIBRBA575 TaxID=3233343 RepID=UPI0034A2564F
MEFALTTFFIPGAILIFPILIGIFIGYRRGRVEMTNRADALKSMGFTVLIAFGWITVMQIAVLGVFADAADLAMSVPDLGAIFATSALFWLPITIITFLIRALRSRAQ